MFKPVESEFYVPLLPVSIVQVSGGGEFLRSMLESLRCTVTLHRPGTPCDFLKVIALGENAPRYLIICGHGAEDGLHFGEYIPEIDTSMLRNECLPAAAIQEKVALPGCTVISATCYGGQSAMAEAFLAGGVKEYIGSSEEPDGMAMNVFLVNFFFAVMEKGLSDEDAWRQAAAATDHADIRQLRYYDSIGVGKKLRDE
jgi:hypothetical protein